MAHQPRFTARLPVHCIYFLTSLFPRLLPTKSQNSHAEPPRHLHVWLSLASLTFPPGRLHLGRSHHLHTSPRRSSDSRCVFPPVPLYWQCLLPVASTLQVLVHEQFIFSVIPVLAPYLKFKPSLYFPGQHSWFFPPSCTFLLFHGIYYLLLLYYMGYLVAQW